MPPPPAPRAREGNRGTTLHPGRPAHTPHTGTSGKPLPGLPPPYGPAPPQVLRPFNRMEHYTARLRTPRPLRSNPRQALDADSKEDSICAPVAGVDLASSSTPEWMIWAYR